MKPDDEVRRTLLKAALSAGLGLGFPPRPARGQDDTASVRPREGDVLVKAGDPIKKPLTPADVLPASKPVMAWAMDPISGTVRSGSRLNQVLVLRLDPVKLSPETRARAADGVVAYTAICTHMGCEVDDWLANEQRLYCPCHGSKFDPTDGARVVEGEAPRPLPSLPLKLEDGKLIVAAPFTARVGFESA